MNKAWYRTKINRQIRAYWLKISACRSTVLKKVLPKKKVPSFTRHNGNRIKRLAKKWVYPKGSHGNKITRPKIGYKNRKELRFRRAQDGLEFILIKDKKDLLKLKNRKHKYQVGLFSRTLGAEKRVQFFSEITKLGLPLYITK